MTDEHIVTAGSLKARLQSARMEIDDDDEDIVEVSIELTNESAIPVGGLEATIQTSTGSKIEPIGGVTSIGPGLTRSFSFAFKLSDGDWSFTLNGQGQTMSLGPYDVDFEFQQEKGRKPGNAIGSSLFMGAFDNHLDDFGSTQERELINANEVQMSTFFGENSQGGSTKISSFANVEEDGPRKPPWETSAAETPSSDTLLSASASLPPVQEEKPPIDLLTLAPKVAESVPPTDPVEPARMTPPPIPTKTAPTPPPTPPAAAQTVTENTPPSTPSGPPSGPPSGQARGPQSGRPTVQTSRTPS